MHRHENERLRACLGDCRQVRCSKRKGKEISGLDAGEVSCGHTVRASCVPRGEDAGYHVNAVVNAELMYHICLPELVASGYPPPPPPHPRPEAWHLFIKKG